MFSSLSGAASTPRRFSDGAIVPDFPVARHQSAAGNVSTAGCRSRFLLCIPGRKAGSGIFVLYYDCRVPVHRTARYFYAQKRCFPICTISGRDHIHALVAVAGLK